MCTVVTVQPRALHSAAKSVRTHKFRQEGIQPFAKRISNGLGSVTVLPRAENCNVRFLNGVWKEKFRHERNG